MIQRFGACNFIQFFGGEPTLNPPAIHAVVDEIETMTSEGSLAARPEMGIVTNGSLRNAADFIAFCKDHQIAVTVSLDGPPPIHDALRPNAGGRGTYEQAVVFVRALVSAGVGVAIESVYTSLHIDRNFSIVDLFELCRSLGVKKHVLHTAYPPAPARLCPFDDEHRDALIDNHMAAIDWWFEALLGGEEPIDVYFKDLLLPILHGAAAGVAGGGCPAGDKDFSVGPDGAVYSCHLLYGEPRYRLGDILSDRPVRKEESLPVHVGEIESCRDCFARQWCQPCGALNLRWGDPWTAPGPECELRKAVVGRIGELAFAHLDVPDNPITETLKTACLKSRSDLRLNAQRYADSETEVS
jgi:uncharacterized protein